MSAQIGRILHLQRLSTEDGPGIRTTVFFKGCPLHCGWCHNPESIAPHPQLQWLEHRCIGCLTCLDACPHGLLTMDGDRLVIDRTRCDGCGVCTEACPTNALELLGQAISVDELIREVVKDRAFYDASAKVEASSSDKASSRAEAQSGGVTASGGEPLTHSGFVADFFARLHDAGIHTALDTCGIASRQNMARVLPHVDLVLFDLKEIDPARHKTFTGQSNEVILDRLNLVHEIITTSQPDTRLWIRTPLIPGATATKKNLLGLGAYIARHLNGTPERWELCAFNNLCRDKYSRLGIEWAYAGTPLLTARELVEYEQVAKRSGVDPKIVIATGVTKAE